MVVSRQNRIVFEIYIGGYFEIKQKSSQWLILVKYKCIQGKSSEK